MSRLAIRVSLVPLILLAAACTRGPTATSTPSPPPAPTAAGTTGVSPSPSSSPSASASGVASTQPPTRATPAPTPTPGAENGLLLVDADTLAVHMLFEGDGAAVAIRFADDGSAWIRTPSHQYVRFGPDGTRVEESDTYPAPAPATPAPTCQQTQPGDLHATIDGVAYHANCGSFSAGGAHMLYNVDLVPNAASTIHGAYENWVLDLATGATTRVDATLHHCGGCDLREGPSWSPSGRYLIVTETGGHAVYLYDAERRTTRLLGDGHGMGGFLRTPSWSPDGDRLLYPDGANGTVLEDLDRGTVIDIPAVAWPAGWAWQTPSLIYSPMDPGMAEQTTVADPVTGAVLGRWAGSAVRGVFFDARLDERGIARYRGQPAALLSGAPDCGGIRVEHPLVGPDGLCLRDAHGAVFSPDATQVAFARFASSASRAAWEIAVVDLATGAERTVPHAPIETDVQPPLVRWSPTGATILVEWPAPGL